MAGKSVQKNLRITPELDGALKAASVRSGLSESELLRRGIEQVCVRDVGLLEATGPVVPRESPRETPVRPSAGRVDLSVWLAGRTGQPRSLVRRDISRGLVEVRGRVVSEFVVDGPLAAGDVRVAGELV